MVFLHLKECKPRALLESRMLDSHARIFKYILKKKCYIEEKALI